MKGSFNFKFDHRSFNVKHEHNQRLYKTAASDSTLKVPTDADMGGRGDPCLQAELGPPPVSPLGVVPETGRHTTGFYSSFNDLIITCMEELIPRVGHSFTSCLDSVF